MTLPQQGEAVRMSTAQIEPKEHIAYNEPLIRHIKNNSGIGAYVAELEKGRTGGKVREAFDQRPRACICSDGRIDAMRAIGEPAVRLPGIIALEERWDDVARRCYDADITDFYSHAGCGAMAAMAKQHGRADVDQFAKEQTEKFCKQYPQYKFKYKGHIGEKSMETIGKEHPELCLYYDMTGQFEQSMLRDTLPQGFALSANLTPDPLPRMLALLGIAFGEHGAFGPKGRRRRKVFTIYVIETDSEKMEATKSNILTAIFEMLPPKISTQEIDIQGVVSLAV